MDKLLGDNGWQRELASILPLSFLIDFINVPVKFHLHQLCGNVPIWSWAVTPLSARILLSTPHGDSTCYLDRFGESKALECIDGRYGDRYFAANSETLRLCLDSQRPVRILNQHQNMNFEESQLRPQWLEIVHVTRENRTGKHGPRTKESLLYHLISSAGWLLASGGIVVSGLLKMFFAMGFLMAVVSTGVIVRWVHGRHPRRLLVNNASLYQRLVVAGSHMNGNSWQLFVGESTVVNSLLNRTLASDTHPISTSTPISRFALSLVIAAQWACALGAAASKDWNAYIITFWILLCISTHVCLLPPSTAVSQWMSATAKIQMTRYSTVLSSRRALLNTIIALNPDSFNPGDQSRFRPEALAALDPILAQGQARSQWEDATLQALQQTTERKLSSDTLASGSGEKVALSMEWLASYQHFYWCKYISEGIYIAARVVEEMDHREQKAKNLQGSAD